MGIFVGGLLGFSYDLIQNQYVKMTSALTMAVAGNVKLVVLVVISYLTFEKPPTPMKVLGICVGLSGCFGYSYHRHTEGLKQRAAQQQAKLAAASAPAPSEQTILISK